MINTMIFPILISAIVGALFGVLLGKMFASKGMGRSAIDQIEFMRNLLAFLLTGAFISVLPVLTFKAIPSANEQILTYMLGQLSGMATMALGFYFVKQAGQDAVDAKKTENTEKAFDTIKKVAETAGGKDGVDALHPGDTVTLDAPTDDGDEQ